MSFNGVVVTIAHGWNLRVVSSIVIIIVFNYLYTSACRHAPFFANNARSTVRQTILSSFPSRCPFTEALALSGSAVPRDVLPGSAPNQVAAPGRTSLTPAL